VSYLYAGTILIIDLNQGKISREPTSSYSKDYLGGRGINIRLLYDHVSPGVDPLADGNVIIFGSGPLTGTCPASGRTDVMAKSPMTGLLGDSNMGGYFSPELKYAGYDHIVITGKSDRPVYIWINNDKVDIRDACKIWGKDTYETQNLIRQELNDLEAKVACIGPAGENLVRFASIQSELGHGAGRTGMGTVMGSKNLKAIAVHGTKAIKIASPSEYLAICKELEILIRESNAGKEYQEYGTARNVDIMLHAQGYVRNLQSRGTPPEATTPLNLFKKFSPKKVGCFSCPNRCMEFYEVPGVGSGVISCEIYVGSGVIVDNNDPDVWAEGALFCQRQGLDAASAGPILAWAMELYQRGIITTHDTDGIPMEWGSKQAILDMLKKIVNRDGFGDVLADGMLLGARRIGQGAEKYALHCKGLPILEPPIGLRGLSLACAVGPRGDHHRSYPTVEADMYYGTYKGLDQKQFEMEKERCYSEAERISGTKKGAIDIEYDGKPAMVIHTEDLLAITDSLGICKWTTPIFGIPAYTPERQAKMLSLGLGMEFAPDMLFQIANKIRCLERAFDVREGLTRSQDTLPRRLFETKVDYGERKDVTLNYKKFEDMKSQYYSLRGWDAITGIPTEETLTRLRLGDIARDLVKAGKLSVNHKKAK